ncbi:DUF1648 domain-containing protein [Nonomuraea cavernae]|uniref:DUF1648 domain-containing protein n=1 Tax=Nonomuraea cavernae TaxID=2045107 RepID=A0A918DN19_9ACTN|nr:DUF1648 domain-containing protein [Nonomuraea cavernae]MCA2188470.1 DUF1648 domain-containing protein [Nonomuraea cavernae]GGO73226.1 hypothetical protein GCM10012289_43120 [Nonomuraea cavernae]
MNPRSAAALWGAAITAALVAVPLTLRDRLPDPLAVHWGPAGAPDGELSFAAGLAVQVAMWIAIWGFLLAAAARERTLTRRMGRAYWWGTLVGGGLFVLGMGGTTLLANLDAPDWTAAVLEPWQVITVILVSAAAGLLAGHLGRGGPDLQAPAGAEPPRLDLRPGQRVVWVSRLTNPWLLAVTTVAAAGLVVVAVLDVAGASVGPVLPPLGVVLLVGLLTTSLTCRVTADGLRIGFGPFGRPARRIQLSKIDKAWSDTRYPSQVGGWGIRGLPGAATIMLRGGECLIIRYRSGGELAVSVDDAARGAALLNALVAEEVSR